MSLSSSPIKTLIIDADNVRRGMIACALPETHYKLEFAKSVERGLDLLTERQPALVIVGWDETALELCQRIRSLPAGNHCILALMDERFRHQSGVIVESEAAGANFALPFPFDPRLLEERLAPFQAHLGIQPPSTIAEALYTRVSAMKSSQHPATEQHAHSDRDSVEAREQQEWDLFCARVHAYSQQLEIIDYYEILDLPMDCTAAQIKEAYFARTVEFHPDRFFQLSDESLKTNIYEIYKRITEAFKVLSNPKNRSEYDRNLSSPERKAHLRYTEPQKELPEDDEPFVATPAGKKYFHLASLAEQDGNFKSARMYLRLAQQSEPHNERVRERLERVMEHISAND